MTEGEFLEFLNAVDWKMICFNTLCILTIFIAAIAYPISKKELDSWANSDFIFFSVFVIWLFQFVLTIFVLCLWIKDLITTIIWWKAVIFFLYILTIWIGIVRSIISGVPFVCGDPYDEHEWKINSIIMWPIEIVFSLLMVTLIF